VRCSSAARSPTGSAVKPVAPASGSGNEPRSAAPGRCDQRDERSRRNPPHSRLATRTVVGTTRSAQRRL
jgi:hypothetical protein